MPKLFHCSKCGGKHKRHVGSKCQMYVESTSSTPTTSGGQNVDDSTNSQIFEQRIDRTKEQPQGHVKPGSDVASSLNLSTTPSQDVDENSDAGDDVVIPTTKFLKTSKHIQDAMDIRLQELAKVNEQGKFKSQRGSK